MSCMLSMERVEILQWATGCVLCLLEGEKLSLSNPQTFRFLKEFAFTLPAPLLFQFSVNFG